MADEWKELSLREAGVQLLDCDHKTPAAVTDGYPYIAIPQLKNGRLDLSDARQITREDYLAWTRKTKPREWDVIVSRRCNPGETAVVPADLECALGQNLVILRSTDGRVFPPFLRWLLRSPAWWDQVRTFINVGAVFESLKCADIPNFRVPIPPLKEQQAIACILGALDDKIELNRRRNRTLEAMARAIFQSWFVDFDPVKAKAAGRTPAGLSPGLAALFPDRFENSTFGPIPAGWREANILEIGELMSGGTPKTSEPDYWDGPIPWASAKDVSQCRDAFLIGTERSITQSGLDNSATQIIPALCSVVVARGATTGRLTMFGADIAMNQTCYALRSNSGIPRFLYLLLCAEIGALVHAAHGSVFDTITTATFRASKIRLPLPNVASAFERLITPVFDQILNSLQQSSTLATLRDALLPKLISGELRVPDAERIVGRAT